MSPNTVSRLKAQWVDGIHTGVTPEGEKEYVAIGGGYLESKESWCKLLLDLKKRGLPG